MLTRTPPRVQRLGRRVTARSRALPQFVIVGAQKAGTTSLYAYLIQAPDIKSAALKEVHFFDHHFHRGLGWYRSNFPMLRSGGASWITGEASPFYLLHPLVPQRVRETLPDVRLVALLRHPVERAYSHFQHSRARGQESVTDFEEALSLEAERTDDAWRSLAAGGGRQRTLEAWSYLRRSTYAPQLRRWYDAFPAQSLLVITAEQLFDDPASTLGAVRQHLGLGPVTTEVDYRAQNTRDYESLPSSVRERLGEHFASDRDEVERIMGRPTGWRF